ncbi:hypothetical protein Poli38472_002553 [Pythium oligandrum]|uniref:TFIIS N-terminal domain-containing protein n=1 Tax=Pythium oligandrum TaxID=41045 RepID=A0A8K1CJY4_PYTOL|nr:hypothetical protein Poli38472_002553 [Pythium oligandrum]|eukprot:TMW63612.1 hypothetical protein Poli38472_002553 [Pythium oligandrum]
MATDARARQLEEEVLQLYERALDRQTLADKQRLYSLVGQFLLHPLNQAGHWWCSYPTLMTFMVRLLELYPGPDSVRMFYERMAHQLGRCCKCVDIYHSALPSVRAELENEFTAGSVTAFFHKLQQLDTERIQLVFSAPSGSTSEVVVTTFYEVLSNRRLWSDFRVIRVISKWSSTPAVKNQVIDVEQLKHCPGLYQWLVSPDSGIRAWATVIIGRGGKIDVTSDSERDSPFLKVLDEWMYILENSSFNATLLTLDLPSTEELPLFLDTTNCVKTPTNQILWAALDTVMQNMSEDSVEALLESFDNLPDLVFNYLNDADPATTNPQITFVICKCYGSLLKVLGHRYWNHTVHSPKVVLDLVIQHCQLPSWRVFVTKQLLELLPPLLLSMRPPSISKNELKVDAYFAARDRVLHFLLDEKYRPDHFKEQVLDVAASKAVSTVICDCYEPRLAANTGEAKEGSGQRDDGALPELSLVDFSVAESAFWWPCSLEQAPNDALWMNHLSQVLVNPNNVPSLVDHVAITIATLLSKHMKLAKDLAYSSIANPSKPSKSISSSKPVVIPILERLCAWPTIATIPIPVHGALFEFIGGVAEMLNVLTSQASTPSEPSRVEVKATLIKCENLLGAYLKRVADEVLVKGLTNPLRFPVVAQHISVCLLSPSAQVDQTIKRLLTNAAANKATPERIPTSLESFLVVVHRNTEAFLRGLLSFLQSLRLFDFALAVGLPTVKKSIFVWTKVFEMLGGDIKKALATTDLTEDQSAINGAAALQKLPMLIGDFIVNLITSIYGKEGTSPIEEATAVHCLDFGIAFWKFWTQDNQSLASSKRFCGMVSPLVKCVQGARPSEQKRGAEFLMISLETFLRGGTRLDDAILKQVDSIKNAGSIDSKKSTDFRRVTGKFKQLTVSSRFFAKRPTKSQRTPTVVDLTSTRRDGPSSGVVDHLGTRPMSAKAAAREQARLVMERSTSSTIFESAPKKAHSFYDEDDLIIPTVKKASSATDAKSRPAFSLSQVTKDMPLSRAGGHSTQEGQSRELPKPRTEETQAGSDEEDEEDDSALELASLFYKIKNTSKAIPTCSLLPFYRHLLQLCMPTLLTREFENEKDDRELEAPSLTFKRNSEYVNAYLPLLLEECHNEIQEGLRSCYFDSGKSGHLLRYESEKPREGMRCISLSVVEAGNAGGMKKNDRFAGREKLFRNADVVLLRSVGNREHVGNLDFLGVILISEAERGKRRQSGGPKQAEEEEVVKVLFLNDGELSSVTEEVAAFKMEALTADAIADTEWRVTTLCNLVTSAREYIALRSVDMFPEHLRNTILSPNMFKSTQSELLTITSVLDDLRALKSEDSNRKIVKLLKRLNKMEVTLPDLRATSIGKAVNKLRKHDSPDVKTLSSDLKDKWTKLMDEKDSLDAAPRFVPPELWNAIRPQYNQSQLQSIHSVLNNYRTGISLLQGPPGTGKTKTIMALLSGFLSMKIPATALLPTKSLDKGPKNAVEQTKTDDSTASGSFTNFDLVREVAAKQNIHGGATFSLGGVTASTRILRRSDAESGPKQSAIQTLKNASSVRSRLEQKLTSRSSQSSNLVQRAMLGPSVVGKIARPTSKVSNVLLCAPSNGAVDELVLRIVTDGLTDSSGNVVSVRAPSVHPNASSDSLSIVRLGNPGEDAPDIVKAVCLPQIIKQELEAHPKTVELRSLQDRQRTLRASIREFHDKKNENAANGDGKGNRRGLAKMHAELTECSGRVRRLREEVSKLESKMTASILSHASIIACTLSKAGSGPLSTLQRGFDALIIDEAAQAVEVSTLVPIRERVARVVLVGDPKQLPATVKSVVAANARYDRSLFERIAESGVAPSMLRVQYRMHPFLREFPSKRFYGGMLTDGPSVMERVHKVCGEVYKHTFFQPFLLYDLENTREDNFNGSKFNRIEAAFCVDLCKNMFEMCPDIRMKKCIMIY